jgi:superfamily II DNA/RNA helicase
MDLSRFSIDGALCAAAQCSDDYRSVYWDKLLGGLFEKNENLYVKSDIVKDRYFVLVFPSLYWLGSGMKEAGRDRALFLTPDDESARLAAAAAREMAGNSENAASIALAVTDDTPDNFEQATLVIASVDTFLAVLVEGKIPLRKFGFVTVDGSDLIAELPSETLRKLQGSLLPSWERKTLVVAGKNTPRSKNFAWDFGDNPQELKLAETMGYARKTTAISREMAESDKIRFILSLLAGGQADRVCIFCNLKSTVQELGIRLGMNNVENDYITGNLNPDRKNQIVSKAIAAPRFALVLTDDGAKGLVRPEFTVVINYDIPLEPEFYFERLNFLKREDPEARVYNLVCERYIYGIPAIERSIDASLNVQRLADTESLPADLSAGKTIELPERGFRGHDRNRGDRDRPRYGEGPRDRDDRPERQDRPARPERPVRPEAAERVERPAQPVRQERPNRPANPDTRPNRPRPPQAQARDVPTDPYAMTMEARLEYYRKKYGGRLERTRSEGKPEDRRQDRRADPNSRPRNQKPSRPANPQNSGRAPAPESVKAPEATRVPQADVSMESDDKPRSLLGKIQDLFGGRKD